MEDSNCYHHKKISDLYVKRCGHHTYLNEVAGCRMPDMDLCEGLSNVCSIINMACGFTGSPVVKCVNKHQQNELCVFK